MAVKFLLASTGVRMNMMSAWTDEVYCSILKDGSISLRASKDGEDEFGGRWWFPSYRGIKTPRQFVDAFSEIAGDIDYDWSVQEDLLPVLFKYAPLFSSLTNLYIEIYYNQGEEDLDFFLFCQKVILSSDVELPEDFKSAVKIVEVIYNFAKLQFQSTGRLPRGQHVLMETSVFFPNRTIRSNKEHQEFRKEQMLKAHVKNAVWEIQRTKLYGFAMSQKRREISDFCREYFEEHDKLPLGTFKVGQIEVVFND